MDEPSSAPSETIVTPRRVLLVDDNVDGLDMMRLALEAKGHEVESASNGNDAVMIAAAFQPEVAVLDIGLPGIDGYELARALRYAQPGLRLIALTGYGQDADAAAAIQAGFDVHCTKPLAIADLLDQIAALEERGVRL
jgi:CheY-like chemotaxis protein